ncbi:MAG: MFS transporter [Betaproteobacteria bacterium]|nr:MFS transporter [Betaproteobacteria bacterium]
MKLLRQYTRKLASSMGTQWMPFADVATPDLPLSRLLRLSMFQLSIGLATALLVGTLNRVMIVELGVPAWWVALSVALPLVFAPLRALIGFRSDMHRSALGLRRLPYLWIGTLLLFGGLAIMPFSLLALSQPQPGMLWISRIGAAMAFLLVGAGMQVTQTAGLALATDLATPETRPRVVALMYTMLLLGLVGSGAIYGWLLADFSPLRLIQVVQGSAVAVIWLNLNALWKQEALNRDRARQVIEQIDFRTQWRAFAGRPGVKRFLWTVGVGTCAFNMQDIILEPYGGQVLHLGVGATSMLTALTAAGALLAFGMSAALLTRGIDAVRLAALGALAGLPAFALVIFSAPLDAPNLFRAGALLIGVGGGLFSVGTLTMAMGLAQGKDAGLALGAWGAVQATAAGASVAAGGMIKDVIGTLAQAGWLGESLVSPVTGYSFVYHLEMYLLFGVLVAIGPLVRRNALPTRAQQKFGLAELPG